MTSKHATLLEITRRITERSHPGRERYLQKMAHLASKGPQRGRLSCTNIAHAVAASPANDKLVLHAERQPNLGIVTSYNDMLSAHQPFAAFPELIKNAARSVNATAQVAGATPAMCDGVTQGQPGMELSLFSRDVIALSTAIALSHDMFDASVCLGICDKIVPGLLMGALSYGHLPSIFVPAGPMTTGMANSDKAKNRQLYAQGKIDRHALLESESASYHSAGTCTFYGTANSNQMLMEVMGLHLPGSAFVNPGTPLRDALTQAASIKALELAATGKHYTPLSQIVDVKCIVNGLVGLLATGGSSNHTIHMNAIARCAGITIDWDDLNELNDIVPLICHIYPSGKADVNQFHAAGGMALVIKELLKNGLLHEDVNTVVGGNGLHEYTKEPWLDGDQLAWREGADSAIDKTIISTVKNPFANTGGTKLVDGNMGRAIVKTAAIADEHFIIEAPAVVFHTQSAVKKAFDNDELNRDFVAVIKQQGPSANGMPELHKLTPVLGILLDQGFKVALVTDGRMSGASGKVPAAIHVSPECLNGGPLGKVRDGDIIEIDVNAGTLQAKVSAAEWTAREQSAPQNQSHENPLFEVFRSQVTSAETGAISLFKTL
ncbi:MAG: phosphogluconate dehydratase [Granulosicoccaceae bacterium]